jgi:hypothetical protein
MHKTEKAQLLKPLHFGSAKHLAAICATLDRCSAGGLALTRPSTKFLHGSKVPEINFVVYECQFNQSDIESICNDQGTPHRIWNATSIKVNWDNPIWNRISFNARLALCRTSCGKLFFQWEVLTSGVPIQESEVVEMSAQGYITVHTKEAEVSTVRILPSVYMKNNRLLKTSSDYVTMEAGKDSHMTPSSPALHGMLCGGAVTCTGRFDLCYMNEPQQLWFCIDG